MSNLCLEMPERVGRSVNAPKKTSQSKKEGQGEKERQRGRELVFLYLYVYIYNTTEYDIK